MFYLENKTEIASIPTELLIYSSFADVPLGIFNILSRLSYMFSSEWFFSSLALVKFLINFSDLHIGVIYLTLFVKSPRSHNFGTPWC